MIEKRWLDWALRFIGNSTAAKEAEGAIQAVLNDYQIRKHSFCASDIAFFEKLAHMLLYICFKFRLENSNIVSQVLRFSQNVPTMRGFSILYGRRYISSMAMESVPSPKMFDRDILPYFLNHANSARLTFNDRRLMDNRDILNTLPLVKAVNACDVECLRILLRYGCEIPISTCYFENTNSESESEARDNSYTSYCNCRLIREIRRLLHIIYRTLCIHNDKIINEDIMEINDCQTDSETEEILLTLNLLFRSICYIPPKLLKSTIMVFRPGPCVIEVSTEFFKKVSTKGYLPKLDERTISPSSLQHLSRCSVRKSLHDAWKLPHGIQELSVPRILMKYLDLDED